MFNEIMQHLSHFEQSKVKTFNGQKHKFGVPETCFPQSMTMEEVTIEDAFEYFYLPLWGKSLVDYLPEDIRPMFFDCCIITSPSQAVRLVRQTIGFKMEKTVMDTGLCEEMKRFRDLDPHTLLCCYAGRLHTYYANLAPLIGLQHQLNIRLVACYDIAR